MRFAILGLIVAVVIAFSPVFAADFSNWDDNFNVSDNPKLNPPTWQSAGYYWSHSMMDLYIPMTYTAWAALAAITYVPQADPSGWHLNPYIFHAANVVVHIGSALLVFSILRKLIQKSLFAAWVGAMLFALHPMQVESVAWIAGLKDVLAGMFALLSLRLYLQEGASSRQRWYFGFATTALMIAMLCKPIAMVVPMMAAAMDWILGRRSHRQIVARLAMWIPLAVGCAMIAKMSQPPKYAEIVVSPPLRLLVAGDAIAFYLWKLLWPISLGVDYGRSPANVLAGHVEYLTCLVPIVLAIVLWFGRRRFTFVAAGAAIFVIGLLPLLGFIPFDFQRYSTVADHYLYLPMFGVSMAAASFIASWRGRTANTFVAIVLTLLGIRTFLQTQYWRDSYSLFNHAVQVNPQSWVGHENLSLAFLHQGDLTGAKLHAERSLQIKADFEDAQANLANILFLAGDLPGAIAAGRRAVKLDPNSYDCWEAQGNRLTDANQPVEAIQAYRKAQQLKPADAKAASNLAASLADNAQLDEAIQWYRAALQLDPALPEAQAGLARATVDRDRRQSTQPTTVPANIPK